MEEDYLFHGQPLPLVKNPFTRQLLEDTVLREIEAVPDVLMKASNAPAKSVIRPVQIMRRRRQ